MYYTIANSSEKRFASSSRHQRTEQPPYHGIETVYNLDLCHLNHYYSHWSILDKINSKMQTNMESSQKMRRKKHLATYAASMEMFIFFPQSHQTF